MNKQMTMYNTSDQWIGNFIMEKKKVESLNVKHMLDPQAV